MKPNSIKGERFGRGNPQEPIRIGTPEWLGLAACAGMEHPDEAFPRYYDDANRFIRRYCWDCPVVRECAELGISIRAEYGVFGGNLIGADREGPAPEPAPKPVVR